MFFQEYNKALEDADEKVQLANQIYELVSWQIPYGSGGEDFFCGLICYFVGTLGWAIFAEAGPGGFQVQNGTGGR